MRTYRELVLVSAMSLTTACAPLPNDASGAGDSPALSGKADGVSSYTPSCNAVRSEVGAASPYTRTYYPAVEDPKVMLLAPQQQWLVEEIATRMESLTPDAK